MLHLELGGFVTDTTLPNVDLVDPILDGDGGGIRQLFDLAYAGSWPSQAAPANGAAVLDMSPRGNDLIAELAAPGGTTYQGGGFDFSAVTTRPQNVLSASGKTPLQSIWDAANDYFLVCGYFRLPAVANPSASLLSLFNTGDVAYNTPGVDMLMIGLHQTNGVSFRRQTNGGGTVDMLNATIPAEYYGKVAQVAYSRTAAGCRASVRTSLGTVAATGAVGSNNTGNFGAQRPRWGLTSAFTLATPQRTDIRVYRGFIDDLSLDTRDPAAILDADWNTVSARFT